MGLSNRFYNRAIRRNDSDIYEEIIKENRGLPNGLDQYTTAEFNYPTAQQITNLTLLNHIWRVHDKFYKLSYEYYGDSRFWWAIAWFNMKPTEAHVKVGEVVRIALPIDLLISYYGL
jgi:hypothetical protein